MRNHNNAKTNRELVWWRRMDLKAFHIYWNEIKKRRKAKK
jgi:hypothetical protein